MADIVIVPTYDRPEYLWVCLEKLHAADGAQDNEVWICEDNHVGGKDGWAQMNMIPVLEEARRLFNSFRYLNRHEHNTYGNSVNVLASLREAIRTDAQYVYLVEDDVMVMPDFFLWHKAVRDERSVSCAERFNHSLNFAVNGQFVLDETFRDPLAYIKAEDVYSSLGVCFPTKVLRGFFSIFDALMEAGKIEFGPGVEQDILIKQYLKRAGVLKIWPYVPRCYHMGWYGYHRNTGMRFNGTLEEKVTALRSAITDPARVREMAGAQDIEPLPKSYTQWSWTPDAMPYEVKKYR